MQYAYVNGRILPSEKATLSIFDRGLVLGDGLFETLRAIDYVPEFLNLHYQRLYKGARKLRIHVPLNQHELGSIITQLCKKSKLKDAAVRITLTRGQYQGGLSIDPNISPSIIIAVLPVSGLGESLYTKGVAVALSSISKEAASGLDSSIKTTNYLANIFARAQADKKKCYEAILLGREGDIAELTTASFFCVVNNEVWTPPIDAGILPGITRQIVLKAAKRLKFKLVEKKIFPAQIKDFDEAFLTSSVRGVVPIVRVEKMQIGNGAPGTKTQQIRGEYVYLCAQDRQQFG